MLNEQASGADPIYAHKPSLMGAAWQLCLRSDALEWQTGRYSGRIPYAGITRVRLPRFGGRAVAGCRFPRPHGDRSSNSTRKTASTAPSSASSTGASRFNTVLPPARADRNGQDDDAGAPDVGKNHDLADSSVPVTTTNHLTQQAHVKNQRSQILTHHVPPHAGIHASKYESNQRCA
jgi:hypothetical protein